MVVVKQISFEHFKQPEKPSLFAAPRDQRDDLIQQIVMQCHLTDTEKKQLAKLLTITANTAKWTETDLHALLKKRQDPSIRNYTAFVRWSAKIIQKRD